VTREDARATYTGPSLAWTSSTSNSNASVNLSATIQDITAVGAGDSAYDPNGGNITTARVTFIDRTSGLAIQGCANLTPSLVSSPSTLTGTVGCTTTLSAGSSGASQYTIGIKVDGNYTRDTSADDTVVTVALPLATSFITGGGYLFNPINAAGRYAPDAGLKTNFGFNVKYNKSGTNLQGNVNVIFRRGGRTYQIKSNQLTSLGVQYCKSTSTGQACTATPSAPCATDATATCPIMATFQGKANLNDVTVSGAPVSLGGNLSLQMSLTDKGEPGSSDSMAISVYDGSALLFSSQWDGTKTVEKILNGGNIVAH
jgi:hypothetical protein